VIEQPEFEEAIERVIAGPERKSRLIHPDERRIIAYHEAGHAVVTNALPEGDPVQRSRLFKRFSWRLHLSHANRRPCIGFSKEDFATMVSLLGGRAAEEIIFNDITSGASNDIENVTKLARRMVTRLGMSEKLGPLVFGQQEELVFLGKEIGEQRDYSEAVAQQIDQEVQELVNKAYDQAKQILNTYKDKLIAVAEKLLEVEQLSREEFEAIFPPPVPKNEGIPAPLSNLNTASQAA